jgi:hypothetical protein
MYSDIWRLSDRQHEFAFSNEREAFYYDERGAGKTSALITSALRYAHLSDYRGILLVGGTYNAMESVQETIKQYCPEGKFSKIDRSFYFPQGGILDLGRCGHSDDLRYWWCNEYNFVGLDNIQWLPSETLIKMNRRLRKSGSVPLTFRVTGDMNAFAT